MLTHWIWLAHRPDVNTRMKKLLLQHFPDPEDLYYADAEALQYIEGLTPEAIASLQDKDLSSSEETLNKCYQKRLTVLTYRDGAYPGKLRNIPDPPVVLYYKGQLPQMDALPVIGVVGTRRASAYGLTAARQLSYQIGKCGGAVVSGMAAGVDCMAMFGALAAGAPTVGVLGCGADLVYPKSNRSLFEDTERYGCILSEFPPGHPPARWTFPQRNRIISGMSNGVLVVEAPERSGALITARLAAEQGRDVFVVPGNIDTDACSGSNALLREGAIPVCSGWNAVSEYEGLYPDKIHRYEGGEQPRHYPAETRMAEKADAEAPARSEKEQAPPRKKIDKEPEGPYIDSAEDLSSQALQILTVLQTGEKLSDQLAAETGLNPGILLSELTLLEIRGKIRRLPGKRITLVK